MATACRVTVLTRIMDSPAGAVYEYVSEDGSPGLTLAMDAADAADLGRPSMVTVTVCPHDHPDNLDTPHPT